MSDNVTFIKRQWFTFLKKNFGIFAALSARSDKQLRVS